MPPKAEDISRVLEEVARRRFPTPVERRVIEDRAQRLLDHARSIIAQITEANGVTPMLVGSVAKGTYLKDPDIDLFLRFPKATPKASVESVGLRLGKAIFPRGVEKYAQHPYINGEFEGTQVDAVPCMEMDPGSQIMTAVDRTPLHTQFIRTHLSETQRDQVRYLKAFAKGIGVYGANEEVQGFSGYLCELLIVLYGDFAGTLEHAKAWKEGERLMVPGFPDAGLEYDAPLVLIDPTDWKRNVAQAVSQHNLDMFKNASSTFLLQPSIKFYFPNRPRPLANEEVQEFLKHFEMLCISFEIPMIMVDSLSAQIRKTERSFCSLFKRNGIEVHRSAYFIKDRAFIILAYDRGTFEKPTLHKGPPVNNPHAKRFKDIWTGDLSVIEGPFEKEGFLYVLKRRDFHSSEELIRQNLECIGTGKNLKEVLSRSLMLTKDMDMLNLDLREQLAVFIRVSNPWEF
jgi:tRNA nucleotidyltransferase (CCA-adding enzyme)